ncbi:Mu transposase C-terminal domain-containing protein [Magnetospirillum fulvum]|uniref:Transposase-like Mu n=1 Tax=Magnetospirillum fulvum MGU-K5 TaxID=1316936 RepID=S9TQK2_MAGFU|nr:Mu transposase C-terminal domain-containing protein [Magnetospirillum fulvum]EPY00855.1 transposase-like Mu [Magnetospirillum fulvum MGU-K5]
MTSMYTPTELDELKLPGLPGKRAIQIRAKKEGWQGVKKGNAVAYPVSVLPAEAQEALRKRAIKAHSKELVAKAAATAVAQIDPTGLKAYQRDTMQARAAILAHIDALVAMANEGTLPAELAALVPVANARAGTGRTLTRPTLYNWLKARELAGGKVVALAPATPTEPPIPAWAGPLMDLYARPTKPSLAWAVEELGKTLRADLAPSYDQARRFLLKLDTITRNQGRMGPRALKSYRAYVARDTSELWPTAVYVADGHCFDAEVAHPRHGRPFRPEITTVVDVYTRRIVGWAIGLSENKWDVSAAAVRAFTTCGVCDIWYADNGPGFNNRLWDDELTGLVARLSITKKNSLPYNSQARGVIERLHQTVWVTAAKRLATYMGAAMDGEARQRAFKRTRKDITTAGSSRLLMDWSDFTEFCELLVAAYNDHPHTGLPKTRDPVTGRKRPMTPNEMWADAVAKGWEADVVSDAEADDLFRPYERRQTRRALVELFGNSYFAPALEGFHGEDVLVGYDVADASRVWVRALDGRFITIARFEGHKTSFFPVSAAEQAREQRAIGRLKRNDAHRAEIMAELNPDALLAHQPTAHFSPEALAEATVLMDAMANPAPEPQPQVTADGRPLFGTDLEWVQWLLAHPEKVTTQDVEGLRTSMRSPTFALEMNMNGVAATTLNNLITTKVEVL